MRHRHSFVLILWNIPARRTDNDDFGSQLVPDLIPKIFWSKFVHGYV